MGLRVRSRGDDYNYCCSIIKRVILGNRSVDGVYMSDFLGYVVQGLATGIGVAVGNFTYDKYIKHHLEKADNVVTKIKNVGEGVYGRREEELADDGKVRQL